MPMPMPIPLFAPFFRLPGRWRRRSARRRRMAVQSTVLTVMLLIVLPLYVIYKPPKLVVSYFQTRFPDVLFQINTTDKIVALTIDDAPSPYTSQILHILEENDASATFFVIGAQVPHHQGLLVDIVKAGSELGNHAMHDEPSISLPSTELKDQIDQVDQYIDSAYSSAGTERQAHYFRPGSGFFSRRILDVTAKAGYRTILGSIYPHDPFVSVWWLNAWHILSMYRPGAVIICHDRRSWTLPMLRKVIPALRKNGYQVLSISKFLETAKT